MCAYFTEIVITLAQLSGGGKSVSAFTHMCVQEFYQRQVLLGEYCFWHYFSMLLDANKWIIGEKNTEVIKNLNSNNFFD